MVTTRAKTAKEQRKGGGRGAHPNSRANIEKNSFKPGESGNPSGKPPGTKDRSTILNKWLSVPLELLNPVTKEKERGTVEDEVILALIAKARKGDVAAIKEIQDSMYGKLKEKTEHSFDLKDLTDEEVLILDRILSKLT